MGVFVRRVHALTNAPKAPQDVCSRLTRKHLDARTVPDSHSTPSPNLPLTLSVCLCQCFSVFALSLLSSHCHPLCLSQADGNAYQVLIMARKYNNISAVRCNHCHRQAEATREQQQQVRCFFIHSSIIRIGLSCERISLQDKVALRQSRRRASKQRVKCRLLSLSLHLQPAIRQRIESKAAPHATRILAAPVNLCAPSTLSSSILSFLSSPLFSPHSHCPAV